MKTTQDEFTPFTTPKSDTNNVLDIVIATINIASKIAACFGTYGKIAAAVGGFISGILSLFNGGGKSMEMQFEEMLKAAINDLVDINNQQQLEKDKRDIQTLTTAFISMALNGNGGVIPDTTILKDLSVLTAGSTIQASFAYDINNNKTTNDTNKARYIAKYCYQYCAVAVLRNIMLSLYIALCSRNNLTTEFDSAHDVLYKTIKNQDRSVLDFISYLPHPKENYGYFKKLYAALHMNVSSTQRHILTSYRESYLELDPMKGKLCSIQSTKTSEFFFLFVSSINVMMSQSVQSSEISTTPIVMRFGDTSMILIEEAICSLT